MTSDFFKETTNHPFSHSAHQADYDADSSHRTAYSQKDDDWVAAQNYYQNGEMFELKVIDQNRGGLIVLFGQLQGFIPNSQIPGLAPGKQDEIKHRKIGTLIPVVVIEANKTRNRLIFSAKTGVQEETSEWAPNLEVGQILTGKIVNLVEFGAFANIGNGINGLIHISELSWQRIESPAEVVKIGDRIKVRVQAIDHQRERISLSHKAISPDPWIGIEKRYKIGDLVEGIITSQRKFGIFVKLGAGVEGLLHQSEIPIGGSLLPQDAIKSGAKILLRISNIEVPQQRISLSLQQVTIDEQISWLMHQKFS